MKKFFENFCLIILVTAFVNLTNGQGPADITEDIADKNRFNPDILTSRMYDYTTNTIAYKDKSTKVCYIQRMQKKEPLPLYISSNPSDFKEVENLAGSGVVRFCNGLKTYKLLVPVRNNSKLKQIAKTPQKT